VGTAVSTFVPQFKQNLAWGGSSVWQLVQRSTNGVPQLIQNLAVSGFSAWQLGQFISNSALCVYKRFLNTTESSAI
jgi:spore germination protein YaaH